MKSLYTLIFTLFLTHILLAQSADTASYPYWIEMMQDQDVNFYKTQKAFNTYWENRTVEKGSGFKPFKRWEWYIQNELNADGTYPNPERADQEFKKFDKRYNTSNTVNSNGYTVQSTRGSWTNLGPVTLPSNGTGQPNGLGRINCVGLHPSDTGIILVGAPEGGIWRTANHGKTWTSNTDTLISMQVSSIRFNPKNPSIVYAGTGDRDAGNRNQRGVLKSTDGGVSWNLSSTGMGNRVVGMLAINPNNPDTILAATNSGVYRTLNAGVNWTRVSSDTSHFKDVVYKPGDPQYAYATANGDFYRSTNWGASWTKITSGLPTDGTRGVIAVSPNSVSSVYFVLVKGRAYKGTYQSTNSGTSFTVKSTTPNIMDYSTTGSGTSGQGWYNLDAATDPNNIDDLYVGGVNIFKSTNQGVNWLINAHWVGNSTTPAVHADHHALEWSPDGKRLYSGNDGGINYTSDGGKTWINISSGLAISQIYKIGQAEFDKDLVENGYQDNGSALFDHGKWITNRGGDGMECAIDKNDNNYMYASVYYGNIARSSNRGLNFSAIAADGRNGINESGAWVAPYLIDEGNSNTMFIGYKNLWRSTNVKASNANAVSWTKISNNLGGSNSRNISVLEQSPANPNVLYVYRSDRKLFRTDNANAATVTWVDITTSLPSNSTTTDMEAHPYLPNVIYMTHNRKVYKSINKGATWTDISSNLPSINLRCIVFDRQSSEGIYVGGTPSIYYKDSSMTNWVSFYDGLPTDISVTELEIAYDTVIPAFSQIRAATYGRGLWSSDLYDSGTNAPLVNFEIQGSKNGCEGPTIELQDRSAYSPSSWSWTITPNTYTLMNGSKLTDKNVKVRIDSAGFYSVKLSVSNANGADSVTFMNHMIYTKKSVSGCTTTTRNGTGFGIGIARVAFEDIDNTTPTFNGVDSWLDYTCGNIAFVEPNSKYPIFVTTGRSYDEFVEVYIDFNNDNDFSDPGERVVNSAKFKGTHVDTIAIPATGLFNTFLKMRVMSDFNSLSNNPCKALNYGEAEEYLVYINSPEIDILSSKDSLCAGNSAIFEADIKGIVDSLQWNFGSTATPQFAAGTGPHKVSFGSYAGNKIIELVADSGNFGFDTLVVLSQPQAALTAGLNPVCANTELTLLSSDTVNGLKYEWFKNGVSINKFDSNLTIANTVIADSGVYSYVAAKFKCRDTSNLITISVLDAPTANFSGSAASQCLQSNSFSFSNNSNGNQLMTPTWTFGDGFSLSANSAQHSYSVAGLYRINLTIRNQFGCSDSFHKMVYVNENPVAQFTANDTNFCEDNAVVVLKSNSSIGKGNLTTSWDFGDGSSSTLDSVSHTYLDTGKMEVILVSISDSSCTDTAWKRITISPLPNSSFASTAVNSSTFTFTPTNTNYVSYQWKFGDGNTSTKTIPTHSYVQQGAQVVELRVSDKLACSSMGTGEVQIEEVSGIEVNQIEGISIFPNPNKGAFTVHFATEGMVSLRLINNLGQAVWFKEAEIEKEENVAITNISKGVYILYVELNGLVNSHKIIVN